MKMVITGAFLRERNEVELKEGLWWDKSWNPVTGCGPISEGCANCWARRMSKRLAGRFGYPKDEPFRVTWHPERLEEPTRWKKPCKVAVCLMGDIAHKDVKESWFEDIMGPISDCSQHLFLILTKRPERLKKLLSGFWPFRNFWLGVSVENQKTADERIPILLEIPAKMRFVSIEPMLGPVDLSPWLKDRYFHYLWGYEGKDQTFRPRLNWVILGGETGPKARAMHPDWPRKVRDKCKEAGVPFFFKNMGSAHEPELVGKITAGRLLDGKLWEEWPE